MKKVYIRFRIALMAFALGLAVVYMAERLPILSGEVPVELPTAVSTDVFPVFVDKSRTLTREKNCGKDPADPQARQECTNEKIFGNRHMSLYARYELINCVDDGCSQDVDRETRRLIWRHWKEKTRVYLTVKYCGKECTGASHYFIEPIGENSWQLSTVDTRSMWLYVDGEYTEVTVVEGVWSYDRPRWKTVTPDEAYYGWPAGKPYLQFENITGDTVTF